MEDNNKTPFKEKLAELLDFARKKKNVLEYQEVNDFFADYELEPDRVEHIYFAHPSSPTRRSSRRSTMK